MAEGVWRTINGARVFIAEGQTLNDALFSAGFKTGPNGTPQNEGHGEYTEHSFVEMVLGKYLDGDKDLFPKSDEDELKTVFEHISEIKRENYEDFNSYYRDYREYANYAMNEGILKSMKQFTWGANQEGYGLGADARTRFDEKHGISKFIDANDDTHYNGGSVYRGIMVGKAQYANLTEAVSSGTLISQNGPSSWSPKESVAQNFTKYALKQSTSGKIPVVFVENKTQVKSAISLGVNSQQSEVLYSGSVKFKPISSEKKDGITYIYVREVKP